MKEYAFASALLLNNNICVYFLENCIRFNVAYESYQYLKYPCTIVPHKQCQNSTAWKNRKTDKSHMIFL